MINEEKFKRTYENFDREIVGEIIDIFLNEYDERINKLNNLLGSGQLDELSKSAHAFKGVISNFETECAAYREISEIENLIRNFLNKKEGESEHEDQILQERLSEIMNSFSKNLRQMYNQLKKMRTPYTD
jgi:HPt (histidine-containing phosphotransfer) domain-containing protein